MGRIPHRTFTQYVAWVGLGVCLVFLGCGGDADPNRRAIYGSVQLNGHPVEKGAISFLPAPGSKGPAAVTVIAQGEYRFTAATGPFPGAHRVVIDIESPAAAEAPAGTIPSAEPATGDGAGANASAGIKVAPTLPTMKPGAARKPARSHWELEFAVPEEGAEEKNFELTE